MRVLKCKNEIYERIELKRVEEKNGLICLVIMFNTGGMVIKMSKMAKTAKTQSQLGQNIEVHLKDLV